MRSKTTTLHPLLILLAAAMASVLFVVSCGGGEEATEVAQVPEVVEEAESAQAPEVVDEAEGAAAELAATEEAAEAATETAEAAELAQAPEEGTPKRGGTLTMAMVADFGSLDPPMVWSQVDQALTQALYDNLLMIQPDGSVKPELAASWEANDDLSSYTFHLRKGVKFHHGKDFKAEDVLFTFERLMDPVLDSPIRPTFDTTVEDIVALDDYTVRFDLVGPNAFFLDALSLQQVRIMPANVDVERLHLEAFGTGPFMLEELLPGERVTMVRNPEYWEEGKPYLDKYVILNVREAATRAEALKSGDVDVVFNLDFQSVPSIEAHPETMVLETPGSAWIGMPMRNDIPPFDNKLVRQAMQAATDRESILQAAQLGRGEIAYDHPIPSDDPLFSPQHAASVVYDPELAKQLLAEAGYPDGIDVTLHTSDIGAGMVEMAVAFKEGAAPAGIRVDVQRVSSDLFWDSYWSVEPFTVTWWAGRPNPDLAMSIQYQGSWNAPNFLNEEFDQLLLRGRGETLEERKVTYDRIQEILIDEVPRLVVAFKPMLYGARNNVRGVVPHPLGPIAIILQDGWLDD